MKIQNLWCVGRNYAEHAKELKNEIPASPLIFLKSGACLTHSVQVQWPEWAMDVHHEIELVLQVDENLNYSKLGLGLDLTERTLQNQLKAKGQPWTLAKSFIQAAPISPLLTISEVSSEPLNRWYKELEFSFSVDEQMRQETNCSQMLFDPLTLLSFIKKHFPLQPNDLIFTGTPAGVGSLQRQQRGHSILQYKGKRLLDWKLEFT